MTYDNLFHIAFFIAALVVTFTSIVFTKVQKRTDLNQNKIFLAMNYCVFINALTCLLVEILEKRSKLIPGGYEILFALYFIYFFIHTALAPMLFAYMFAVTGSFRGRSKFFLVACFLPFLITELMVIINPVTGIVYSYNRDLSFGRNWGEIVIYIVAIAYFSVAFANLMVSWNALTRRRRWSLVYFCVLTLAGVIIQLIDINIKSELFTEALALTGLMLSVENEDDKIDSETGFYNRNAFKIDFNNLFYKKRVFYVVCMKVTNTDAAKRIVGLSNAEVIIQEVASFIKTIIHRYFVYRISPNTLLFLLQEDSLRMGELDAMLLAQKIQERFEEDWEVHGKEIKLSNVVMVAEIPKHIHSLSDLIYMLDSPVPAEMEGTILQGGEMKFLMRRAAVEAAITNGLEQGGFEVYYQPTYCTDGVTLHGAEALIRLHDSVLGDLYPDEFIPIAEQTGYIDDIDDFVLKEVCTFLKSGEPTRLGMECINVNLSVLQCMQDNFVEKILKIVESYGISKSLINFEITESVSASDYELLSGVIAKLKENGFQFSMDDYVTGHSNMHTLFSLAFDIVKIDKSILWDAEKSELGEIILENCIHMIKQMKRKILVEGVETSQHVEKLRTLGVDYLQGYFFSRPITKKELLVRCSVE